MDAETYGAAESVRTPTADRCCHEGRQNLRWHAGRSPQG